MQYLKARTNLWKLCLAFLVYLLSLSGMSLGSGLPPIAGEKTPAAADANEEKSSPLGGNGFLFIGLGDSLTHGTMDATNNLINTLNGWFQRVALSLSQELTLYYRQPLFNLESERIRPFVVPTNLAVDGAEIFTAEGLRYYKRAGANETVVSPDLLCDKLLPGGLEDKYDKVLYPLNWLARQSVSQMDAATWLLSQGAPGAGLDGILVAFWLGNNDSSAAALGSGGSHPSYEPIPLDEIAPEIKPLLRLLMEFGRASGEVSFDPYTQSAIERNLTDPDDFMEQFEHLLTRLENEGTVPGVHVDYLILTLPYYSSVAYLFDSEDIEFYLQKVNPGYVVPPTFKRVAPPGEPIIDYLQGDRISLLTFGLMYALLDSGYTVEYVNQVLETAGQQRDGLVLSEDEQQFIMGRIDDYNAFIKAAVQARGPNFHLIDIGQYMNDALTGETQIIVNGHVLNRKWVRGGGFCLDGVHPGYLGQSILSNFLLEELNAILGTDAPFYDLSTIHSTDPYVDHDGDGWAPGPDYEPSGMTELLFLFKDPDDTDTDIGVELPPDVWDRISDVILKELLGIGALRDEAERLGMMPVR